MLVWLESLKRNFSEKDSSTLILATCYSSMRSYFKIDLIVQRYSIFNFCIKKMNLLGH